MARLAPIPRVLALLAALALLAPGCGASSDSATGDGSAGSSGSGPDGGSVTFTDGTTLQLQRGETRDITLRVQPVDGQAVLLSLRGAVLDASLDRTSATPDAETGEVTVSLTAPTTNTSFTLMAKWGSVTGELRINVGETTGAALSIVPDYAGTRTITTWRTTLWPSGSCEDARAAGTVDGTTVQQHSGQAPLLVDGVPAMPLVAVVVEGDSGELGCVELNNLLDGETREVSVPVSDLPLKLTGSLSLVLGVESASRAFVDALELSLDATASALVGGADQDVTALLDRMQSLSTSPSAFASARGAGSWDQGVTAALGTGAAQVLRSSFRTWMYDGVEGLALDHICEGTLSLDAPAQLALTSVTGLSVVDTGSPETVSATLTTNPGDQVSMSTTLPWSPSRLLTNLAAGKALEAVSTAETGSQALALKVDCPHVAETLVAAGTGSSLAYEGCDVSCSQSLCEAAIDALWQDAAGSSALGSDVASLTLTATTHATAAESAKVVGLQGEWVGVLSTAGNQITLSGTLTAAAP